MYFVLFAFIFLFGNIKARAHCLINFDFVAVAVIAAAGAVPLHCGLLWGWGSLKQHSTWMTNRTEQNRAEKSREERRRQRRRQGERARGMESNETKHPAATRCVQNAQQITLLFAASSEQSCKNRNFRNSTSSYAGNTKLPIKLSRHY